MNAQSANKKGFRVALGSFMVAGLLAILLLASMGTAWGEDSGGTAGPTTTPFDLCATTPPGSTGGGQNGTGNGQDKEKCKTTPPSAVGNSNTQPTTAPSAVGDANQGPVGVVPGLPNTGTGSQTTDDNSWKLIVLGLLLANMLIAGLVMRKFSKSSRSR